MALTRYLRECAERAAVELGDDVDASIMLSEHGVTLRAGSSNPGAARCDQAEVRAGEGPCIDAMAQESLLVVPSVRDEDRWRAWRAQTATEGFVKALAAPAAVTPAVAVALNVYSREGSAWQPQTVAAAERYAQVIARAVRLHLLFADVDESATGLRSTLSGAAAVERALGAIMETDDCSANEARHTLELAALKGGISERAVAEPLLRALDAGGAGDIVDGPDR